MFRPSGFGVAAGHLSNALEAFFRADGESRKSVLVLNIPSNRTGVSGPARTLLLSRIPTLKTSRPTDSEISRYVLDLSNRVLKGLRKLCWTMWNWDKRLKRLNLVVTTVNNQTLCLLIRMNHLKSCENLLWFRYGHMWPVNVFRFSVPKTIHSLSTSLWLLNHSCWSF